MNCKQAKLLLVARADGTLDAGQERAVDVHVAGCDSCARELALLRRETALLRGDPTPPAPAGLAARVMAEVEAGPARAGRMHRGALAALVAVGLLIGVYIGSVIWRPGPGPAQLAARAAAGLMPDGAAAHGEE
jgi:anti-sigma factor RsiW